MYFVRRLLFVLCITALTIYAYLFLTYSFWQNWPVVTNAPSVASKDDDTNGSTADATAKEKTTVTMGNQFLDTITESRPLRIWTMDIHVGTKAEFLSVLQKLLGLPAIMRAASKNEIKQAVKNPPGFVSIPCPHPHRQRRLFFEGFRNRPEIRNAHILFHEMKPGNAEFLMPFNKTIIFYLATSHEFGRESPIMIREWYRNIARLSKDPRSAIVANNLYQLRNLQYFTGVKANYIRSMSMYTVVQWGPDKVQFPDIALVNGNRHGWFASELFNATNAALEAMGSSRRLKYLREVFTHYQYPELLKFPCVVFMPYTISTMSQFETYNMGIPTLFPSIDYMVKMEGDDFATGFAHGWRLYWKGLPILKGGPFIAKDCKLPDACIDPHDMNATFEERKAWWRFADYYQWKNVIYYDSPEDLAKKLVTTNFTDVAVRMREELKAYRDEAYVKWRNLLTKVLNPMAPGGYQVGTDYYAAMQERWNVSRAELDESEEADGAAVCDIYSNGPGPDQRRGPKFVDP